MSWLLIILLVLVFVMFALSCVLIVAWIVTGAPNISSATLDLNTNVTVDNVKVASVKRQKASEQATKGVRVLLAANTGGFVLSTGLAGAQVIPEENRLEQTLYIGGKPAVTRTTTFSDASVVRQQGPMQIQNQAAQQEIVQWYQNNASLPSQTESGREYVETDGQFESDGSGIQEIDIGAILEAAQPKSTVPLVTENAQSEEKGFYRERLEPVLLAEAEKRKEAEIRLRNPDQFHLTVRGRNACGSSSTLQLPVHLHVPTSFVADGKMVRWVILHVAESTRRSGELDQKVIWESEPISLAEICRKAGSLEVDTILECSTVSHWLMRLKLVEDQSHAMLASAFFNPSSIISNGPTAFGTDMHAAWQTYRQIIHQP
jgi:hypothetical protein